MSNYELVLIVVVLGFFLTSVMYTIHVLKGADVTDVRSITLAMYAASYKTSNGRKYFNFSFIVTVVVTLIVFIVGFYILTAILVVGNIVNLITHILYLKAGNRLLEEDEHLARMSHYALESIASK